MSAQLSIRIEGTGGPSQWGDQDTMGSLLDEDGKPMWGHFSSSPTWLIRDLTEHFGRKHELAELYPEGWECTLNGERIASWEPVSARGSEPKKEGES